jgi:hypothetical protein
LGGQILPHSNCLSALTGKNNSSFTHSLMSM